jgi:glycine/D-amino acid oxidase-like deaminating enzyme/nitrite reductase/ring-hydroxylating ferredoxin subunit
MGSLTETNPSLWIGTSERPAFDGTLERPLDVVVVGAGIAGLSVARSLVADGADVAVLEAGSVCSGVTAYTTAKVTALQQTTLSEIRERRGTEIAAGYAEANLAAVDRIAEQVAADGIDCDFERASACTFATDDDEADAVVAEHEAATAAGLATRLDATTELPFGVRAAVWLDDQAQFHPRRYCLGLAAAITDAGGGVVEHARVVDVAEDDRGCTVTLADGRAVRAGQVVLASHLPFLDSGGFFARAHPYRSYALAARSGGDRIRGMYISAGAPTRSIRSTADGWTIVGGEGHKVGRDDDTLERYATLQRWAADELDVREIGYRWSAQDYEPADGVPYIGMLQSRRSRTWVATGFRKWGMTNGVVAAMVLADRIAGRANRWTQVFDSARQDPGPSIKELVAKNLDVGRRFVADRVRSWRPVPAADLAVGEAAIADLDGEPVAAYRDDDGVLHTVAADCTHLGCRVAFNTAERSWDCPCHGSRFDVDGHVLQGPAVADLERKGDR